MYKEYFIYTADNTSLPAGSGTSFTNIRVKIDVDFEITRLSHVATDNRIYINLVNENTGEFYNNVALKLNTISADHKSTGSIIFFKPFTLPEPIFIKEGSIFTVQCADFSGSQNSIRLALHGNRIRKGDAPWAKRWSRVKSYAYSVNIALQPNQTAYVTIPIELEAHFLLQRISGTFDREFFILIKDSLEDKHWMNTYVHSNNIIGSSMFPNSLIYPKFIPKGGNISLEVQDLSGLSNNISITFSGLRLYD